MPAWPSASASQPLAVAPMADPVVIDCPSTCTVTVVHELSLPPLQLTAEEGAAISSAILLVWATAWAFRVLIRMLKNSDGNPTQEET